MYIVCNEEALLMAEAFVTLDQTAPNLCNELSNEIQGMKENLHEKFYSVTRGAQKEIKTMKAMVGATWW
jgi:hypothetical protein